MQLESDSTWIRRGRQKSAVARVLCRPMTPSEIWRAAQALNSHIQLRDVWLILRRCQRRGLVRCFSPRASNGKIYYWTDSGRAVSVLKVDGGATGNNFLMQLQADILGVPVVRPAVRETTALGAAYAAGLAVGAFASTDALRRLWQADRTFEPAWDAGRREQALQGWKRAVERTRGWVE